MNCGTYISTLLYQHDCVVVPGLGAFLVNESPASYNKVNKVFIPPTGKLSFNINIKHNDGLLVNKISKEEGITFPAALKTIQQQVEQWHKELKSGNKVHISHVGNLSLDLNKKLVFIQDENNNYNLSSYGLKSFQAITLNKKQADIIPIAVKGKEDEEDQKKKSPVFAWRYAAAIILILLATGSFFSYKNGFLNNVNYTSLVPWVEKSTLNYSERTQFNHFSLDSMDIPDIDINGSKLTIGGDTVKIFEQEQDKTKTKNSRSQNERGSYCVIGGCFREHSNATGLVEKLKRIGFDSYIIGKHKGLYTVAYGSYASFKQAKKELLIAKKNNRNAWVLKY